MRHWKLYRNLALIYLVALAVWICEYRRRTTVGMTEDDVYVQPSSTYVEVASHLYPNRTEPAFYLGHRLQKPAALTIDPNETDPEAIERTVKKWQDEVRAAADHYKRAIDGGLISQEKVFYDYAIMLMRLREDPAKIDGAIAAWRRNFPYSASKPLEVWRREIEAGYQELAQQIADLRQNQELEAQRKALEAAYGKPVQPPAGKSSRP